MTRIIDHPENLEGEKVYDQDGNDLGEIKKVYGVGDDEAPMYVTLSASQGMGSGRDVLVPVARIKVENNELRLPYSVGHLQEAPEIEAGDELSEEEDRALRDYYAIDLADQEVRTDNESYAAQVPDGDGQPKAISGGADGSAIEKRDESEDSVASDEDNDADSDEHDDADSEHADADSEHADADSEHADADSEHADAESPE